MRALVTGCAGFIGSHLSEKLARQGELVVGIDCFTDFYPRWMKQQNLDWLLKQENFALQEANLLSCDIDEIVSNSFPISGGRGRGKGNFSVSGEGEEGGVVVFHLAAQPGVRRSWGVSFNTYVENNILATQRLLEWAKGNPVQRFIYASSSSVYGDGGDLPMKEDSPPVPLSPYGVTKLAAENLCQLYWKSHQVPALSLRYFSVYGPRQRPGMAFHRVIEAILKDKEIEVYGDGNQTRDFTYVDDVVNATISAVQGPEGEVFNIGGGGRIALAESIGMLEELVGKRAKAKYVSEQRGEMRHTHADISKAAEVLGYQPGVKLKEGLRNQIEWMKSAVVREGERTV